MAVFNTFLRGRSCFYWDFHQTYCRLKYFCEARTAACSLLQVQQKPDINPCRTLRSAVWQPSTDEIKNARYSTQPAHQVKYDSSPFENDDGITREVIAKVNEQIENQTCGRLFAVVRIFGKQFKITTEDVVILQNHFVPRCGERVCLDKVLLVGNSDFTLLGRPLLNKDLVRVEATVIEKTLSHVITSFLFVKRERIRRHQFRRIPLTMLRINSIDIQEPINRIKDIEGLEGRIL